MLCVESKMSPGTFYVDKKSFDQITANAQSHTTNNVMNLGDGVGEEDPTIKVKNGIYKVSDEKPLVNAGIVLDVEQKKKTEPKDGQPNPMPVLNFN